MPVIAHWRKEHENAFIHVRVSPVEMLQAQALPQKRKQKMQPPDGSEHEVVHSDSWSKKDLGEPGMRSDKA